MRYLLGLIIFKLYLPVECPSKVSMEDDMEKRMMEDYVRGCGPSHELRMQSSAIPSHILYSAKSVTYSVKGSFTL